MPPGTPALEAACRLRIAFRDVDMHGHVHNGAYFSYFETAITEFLRGHGLMEHFRPKAYAYHVKKVEIIYDAPVGFDEAVEIRVRLAGLGRSSLTFAAALGLDGNGPPLVTATIVWVCVDAGTRHPAPIPAETRDALAGLLSPEGRRA